MKYLSLFSTLSDYTTAKAGTFPLPHVSYITGTREIKYDPYVAPVVSES